MLTQNVTKSATASIVGPTPTQTAAPTSTANRGANPGGVTIKNAITCAESSVFTRRRFRFESSQVHRFWFLCSFSPLFRRR